MTTPEPTRGDIAASLAARRELGPDYDAAFVEAVAERLETAMTARNARAAAGAQRPPDLPSDRRGGDTATTLVIAIVSLVASIPASAIAANRAGGAGIMVVWTAITLINVAYALRRR